MALTQRPGCGCPHQAEGPALMVVELTEGPPRPAQRRNRQKTCEAVLGGEGGEKDKQCRCQGVKCQRNSPKSLPVSPVGTLRLECRPLQTRQANAHMDVVFCVRVCFFF